MKSNRFLSSVQVLVLAAFAMSMVAPQPAVGATYWVTNTAVGGPGSLPQAIADANFWGGGTILFSNVTGTITLTAFGLQVSANVSIIGPGAEVLAISGNNRWPVFKISSFASGPVVISGLTIRDGLAPDQVPGGGIYIDNRGNLTLANCVISNNHTLYDLHSTTPATPGAGIGNDGTLTMSNCVVCNNSSARGGDFKFGNNGCNGGDGGGLYNHGAASLIDCTFRNNSTGAGGYAEQYGGYGGNGGHGGGVYNAGVLSLTRCTLSGNYCGNGGYGLRGDVPWYPDGGRGGSGGSGGGIYNSATLLLTNCTIYGNATGQGIRGAAGGSYNIGYWLSGGNGGRGGSGGGGGGICSSGGLTLHACTVSGNTTAPGGSGGWGGIGFPPGTNGIPGVAGSPGDGGGICGAGTVFNCLVAQNEAVGVGPDISGTFTSLGFNLIGNTNGRPVSV